MRHNRNCSIGVHFAKEKNKAGIGEGGPHSSDSFIYYERTFHCVENSTIVDCQHQPCRVQVHFYKVGVVVLSLFHYIYKNCVWKSVEYCYETGFPNHHLIV